MNNKVGEMRLVVSKSVCVEWSGWFKKFKGNIYHSSEWAETRYSDHSHPLFFHWLDDNNCCLGIAVAIKSWSTIPYIGRFSTRLDIETYPAVRDGDVDLTRSMIKQLMGFAKKGGYRRLTIQSYGTPIMVPDMAHLGFTTTPRIEFILDLTMSETELLKRLSEHHRRKIKKAKKYGLSFEEFCTLDAMRRFRNLQVCSRDRRMQRGEYTGMLDDAYYEDLGKSYFEKNLGRVFLMTHENQSVSGAFITIYEGRAYYVYGGSNDEGFKMDAPALLFWKIFSRCRELGCREFNMGGVPASAVNPEAKSHGLYRFKSGFGGQRVMCLSGSANNLSPIHSALGAVVKKGRNIWKSS